MHPLGGRHRPWTHADNETKFDAAAAKEPDARAKHVPVPHSSFFHQVHRMSRENPCRDCGAVPIACKGTNHNGHIPGKRTQCGAAAWWLAPGTNHANPEINDQRWSMSPFQKRRVCTSSHDYVRAVTCRVLPVRLGDFVRAACPESRSNVTKPSFNCG